MSERDVDLEAGYDPNGVLAPKRPLPRQGRAGVTRLNPKTNLSPKFPINIILGNW